MTKHSLTVARVSAPPACALIKQQPADFQVIEELGFTPNAGGEHLWLEIEKTGWNTDDVAKWLTKAANVRRLAVSYSGLKDKHAITRQWFSIQLPSKPDPDFEWPDGLRLLQAHRHQRKLNRGTHRRNRFILRLTRLRGERDAIEERLQSLAEQGAPNYFGRQRFGREGANLTHGSDWLSGVGEAPRKRKVKSFWLSAVRSHLFNQVLSARVRQGVWDKPLQGDILQPAGSRGLFYADDDPQAAERVATGEVHPTAPLPGIETMVTTGKAAQIEQQALSSYTAEIAGLQTERVEAARRATRLMAADMTWQFEDDALLLRFCLPKGAFATTLLAELIKENGED